MYKLPTYKDFIPLPGYKDIFYVPRKKYPNNKNDNFMQDRTITNPLVKKSIARDPDIHNTLLKPSKSTSLFCERGFQFSNK